jgi:hypothetical protein
MRRGLATLPGIMIGAMWCAILLALLRFSGLEWLGLLLFLVVVGPICGTVMQRRMGGRGIVGGIIGGAISYFGFGVIYLCAYSVAEGLTTWNAGPIGFLSFLAYWGALAGFAVGILTWGLTRDKEPPRKP